MLYFSVRQSTRTSLVCCLAEGDVTFPRTQDKVGKFTLAAWGWCARYVIGGSVMASVAKKASQFHVPPQASCEALNKSFKSVP